MESRSILFNFEIITPLVMAGASPAEPEVREQSINGIFRWWFRFINAHKVSGVKELFDEESRVFGSQKEAKSFRMRVLDRDELKGNFKAYLRMNDASRENIYRWAFSPEQTFTLNIQEDLRAGIADELESVIKFLSLLGGAGARWRRGFGSLMEADFIPSSDTPEGLVEEYKSVLQLNGKSFRATYGDAGLFMNLTSTSIFLVFPEGGFWKGWKGAMNSLRERIYRPLKGKSESITIRGYRGSPLIIQIKKNGSGKYYGVLMVFRRWKSGADFLRYVLKLNSGLRVVGIHKV